MPIVKTTMIKKINEKVLDIKEVTLLSTDEAELAKENIPGIFASTKECWWLRSSGLTSFDAALVLYDGRVNDLGDGVILEYGVCPALRIGNLKSNNLQIGDKIEVADHTWTVISDDMALCDEIIAHKPFNKHYERGNDYESSDIKQFVDDWARKIKGA